MSAKNALKEIWKDLKKDPADAIPLLLFMLAIGIVTVVIIMLFISFPLVMFTIIFSAILLFSIGFGVLYGISWLIDKFDGNADG